MYCICKNYIYIYIIILYYIYNYILYILLYIYYYIIYMYIDSTSILWFFNGVPLVKQTSGKSATWCSVAKTMVFSAYGTGPRPLGLLGPLCPHHLGCLNSFVALHQQVPDS